MASPGYGLWVIGYGLRASLLLLTYYPSPYAPCLSKSAIPNLSSLAAEAFRRRLLTSVFLAASPSLRVSESLGSCHLQAVVRRLSSTIIPRA